MANGLFKDSHYVQKHVNNIASVHNLAKHGGNDEFAEEDTDNNNNYYFHQNDREVVHPQNLN